MQDTKQKLAHDERARAFAHQSRRGLAVRRHADRIGGALQARAA
jgi:hypothetical protein